MNRSRSCIYAALALTLTTLLTLRLLAPRMYPLHADSPANFWYSATGVDLGATRHQGLYYVVVERDRLVYGAQYSFSAFPDYPYQTIALDAAMADFPAVCNELERRASLNNPDDYIAEAYLHWKAVRGTSRNSPVATLMECIDQARIVWIARQPMMLPLPHERDFRIGLFHVAQAARLYWATFLFEALLFIGLILFVFWPYIHGRSYRRKLLHIALFPFLLYLPIWLGYCNSASYSFPTGGILYPYLQAPAAFLWAPYLWEDHLLSCLPPFFLAITQGRAISFADYWDFPGPLPYQLGPVNVAILSLLLTLAAATIHALCWLIQRRRASRRGFPILETPAAPSPTLPQHLSG